MEQSEPNDYQQESANVKLRWNMAQGIGAATVFGLAAAGVTALLGSIKFGAGFSILPVLGVAGVAVLGLGCLYLASKYHAQSIALDHAQQAKLITKGVAAPVISHEPARPGLFDHQHAQHAHKNDHEHEHAPHGQKKWAEAHAPKAVDATSWEQRVGQHQPSPEQAPAHAARA